MLITFNSEEAWHALRAEDLTASTLAGHFGHSSWSSEYSDYCAKAGLVPANSKKDDKLLRAGRALEAGIVELVSATEEWNILRPAEFGADALFRQGVILGETCPDPTGFYLRDETCRIGATPDAVILNHPLGERPLEAKLVSWRAFQQEWEGGEAPVKYWLQGTAQVGAGRASGLPWGGFVVAALVAGEDLKVLDYEYDPEAYAMMQQHADDFWKQVRAGLEPDMDPWRKADREAVKARFRKAMPETLDLTGNQHADYLFNRLRHYADVRKRAEKREEATKAEVLQMLGDYEAARLTDGSLFTAKVQHRAGFAVQPSSFRVIRTKEATPPKAPKDPKPASAKGRKVAKPPATPPAAPDAPAPAAAPEA